MGRLQSYVVNIEKKFILLIDELLRNGNNPISNEDILDAAVCQKIIYRKSDIFNESIKQRLKDAKSKIRISLKAYNLQFIEKVSPKDKRCKMYCYPQEVFDLNIDPVANYREENIRFRKGHIEELILSSSGIIPEKLMAELTLCQIRKKDNDKFVSFETNESLTNIGLLPELYLAIRDKKVISFQYCPYGKKSRKVILHPHFLKEYNNRWFIFGYAIQDDGNFCCNNYALDRIYEGLVEEEYDVNFIKSVVDYNHYFDDIVGVSKRKGEILQPIVIKTKDCYTHERIKSKKIHNSQKEVQCFDEKKQYGLFEIHVCPNLELRGILLSYGSHIIVEGPLEFRKEIEDEIKNMMEQY